MKYLNNSIEPRTRSGGVNMLRAALLLVFLAAGLTPAHAQFTFTSLQYPQGTVTRAYRINDNGVTVGAYQTVAPQHALLIANGQYTPLDASGVLGANFSRAYGINNLKQIVGTYVDDQGIQHGFLLNNGVLTNIDFPTGIATDAVDINDSGVIVGDFFDAANVLHGFVWRAGVFRQIDAPGAADTQATGINTQGDIVGSWDTDAATQGHGFLLSNTGQFVSIDVPAAAPQSTSVLGINDHRQIVGTYTDTGGTPHGFVAMGNQIISVDAPGAGTTGCWGINNAGVIAGNYSGGFLGAFLATPGGKPNIAPVPLNVLWRVLVNGTDRMTSVDPVERDQFPLEGQEFYVPSGPGLQPTQTLYRLLSFDGSDHRDSTVSESGYNIEGPLGSPWTIGTLPGLDSLFEGFNSMVGDSALVTRFEQLPGYTRNSLGVYGYPRFENLAESLLSLSGGGVTIQSNLVAGGSLWRWFWNGMQFINTHDFGRQIQSAFFSHQGINLVRNPTEAGDLYTSPDLAPAVRHGSPIFRAYNAGTTQVTRSIPLEWSPDNFGGGQSNPVIWNTIQLGKDITLNFDGMGSVAKYTTHLVLPSWQAGHLEMPTPYLRAVFKRFWTYDAESDTLTEVTDLMPDACNPDIQDPDFVFTPDFGGVIVSDPSKAFAMGEYAVNTSQGGPVSYLAMWKFFCFGDGISAASFDTVKLDAVRGPMPFPAGDNAYDAYLMTGTVQGVREKMHQLFLKNVR